jgi:hypothetical protein
VLDGCRFGRWGIPASILLGLNPTAARRSGSAAGAQGGLEPVEPADHPLVGGRQPLQLSNHGVHRGSSFTWNITTLEGRGAIRDMLAAQLGAAAPGSFTLEVAPEARLGKQLRRARGVARAQGGLEPVEPADHPLVGGRQPG